MTLSATTSDIRGGGASPIATVVLQIGGIEASYGFALDVVHPDMSAHQVLLGLSF